MADAGPYLVAFLIALPPAQLLVWMLARNSTVVEFWRVIPVVVTGVVFGGLVLIALAELGTTQIVGFALAASFAVWLIAGLFYDFEIRHRIMVSLSIPIIGTLAMHCANTVTGELARQAVGA